ncbi:MAG: hypothetical protein ACLSA6_13665 [Holdemania massiliensis]
MNIGLDSFLFLCVHSLMTHFFVNLQTTKPVVCGALVGLILGI